MAGNFVFIMIGQYVDRKQREREGRLGLGKRNCAKCHYEAIGVDMFYFFYFLISLFNQNVINGSSGEITSLW